MASILVVENEAVLALDLADTLQGLGYDVLGPAATADDACQLARDEHPDVVLMDIRLNGDRDGIAAAQEIASQLGVKVIFLSAESDAATRRRALAVPESEWLAKPCPTALMKYTLAQAIMN